MKIIERVKELGYTLQECPKAAAVYVPYVKSDNHLFIAGQTAKVGSELKFKGKVGRDLTTKQAYDAARLCALRCISVLNASVEDLNKVKRIVRVVGYVNCVDDYEEHSRVINGASELLEQVFAEKGKHTRVAIGVNSLPGASPVEVSMIVELHK